MGYRQSENKNDFFNVLHHLNLVVKTLQFDPIFEPTEEEVKALDDMHDRLIELIAVTKYNK